MLSPPTEHIYTGTSPLALLSTCRSQTQLTELDIEKQGTHAEQRTEKALQM